MVIIPAIPTNSFPALAGCELRARTINGSPIDFRDYNNNQLGVTLFVNKDGFVTDQNGSLTTGAFLNQTGFVGAYRNEVQIAQWIVHVSVNVNDGRIIAGNSTTPLFSANTGTDWYSDITQLGGYAPLNTRITSAQTTANNVQNALNMEISNREGGDGYLLSLIERTKRNFSVTMAVESSNTSYWKPADFIPVPTSNAYAVSRALHQYKFGIIGQAIASSFIQILDSSVDDPWYFGISNESASSNVTMTYVSSGTALTRSGVTVPSGYTVKFSVQV
jgi:flagellar capping protein FliD